MPWIHSTEIRRGEVRPKILNAIGHLRLRTALIPLYGYLSLRLWQFMLLGDPLLTADSDSYRRIGQSAFDFGLVSPTGDAFRAWPITVLYGLAASDRWRMILQFAVATICWSYLIYAACRMRLQIWAQLTLGALIGSFALSTGISNWDATIMSDSLQISAAALLLGSELRLASGFNYVAIVARLGSIATLCLMRPVFVPAVLLLSAWDLLRSRRSRDRLRLLWAASALSILLVAGYSWVANSNIDRYWGKSAGLEQINGRVVQQFMITVYSPNGEEIMDYLLREGAPACTQPPDPLPPDGAMWWRGTLVRECPEGVRWISDNFIVALGKYLASSPLHVRDFFRSPIQEIALQRLDGVRSVPSPIPDPITGMFFQLRTGGGDPLALWFICAAILGTAAALLGPVAEGTGAAIRSSVVGLIALAGTIIISPLDISRVGLPPSVLLRLSLMVIAVAGASALIARREAR